MEHRYRTVWISDIHLGTRDCRVEALLSFLDSVHCEQLYLVGDVIDVWMLKRRWFWPESHNEVIQKLLKCDVNGARITYVPGNHDELLRAYDGMRLGDVTIRNEVVHETADGRRVLVIHGDDFDAVATHGRLIRWVGDWMYYVLLRLNRWVNGIRRRFGMPYLSLVSYLKGKSQSANRYVDDFERFVSRNAAERGMHGVICGHIHKPRIREIDGIQYLNCGDWVESCSAIVEHMDGRLELLDLKHLPERERRRSRQRPGRGTQAPAPIPIPAGIDAPVTPDANPDLLPVG